MGLLEEVNYTASTGDLSFMAKLSDACILESGRCVPTKDILRFKGTLQGQVLTGVVSWYRTDTLEQYRSEQVALKAEDPGHAPHQSFDSYAKWRTYYEPILKRRGPQW